MSYKSNNFKYYEKNCFKTIINEIKSEKNKGEVKILIGTKYNNIYEISEKSSTVQCHMTSHSEGELWGLSVHPTKEIYATASYDGLLRVWDIKTKVDLKKK